MGFGSRVVAFFLDKCEVPCTTTMHVMHKQEPFQPRIGYNYEEHLQIDTTRQYTLNTPFGSVSFKHEELGEKLGVAKPDDVVFQYTTLELQNRTARRDAGYGPVFADRAAELLTVVTDHYANFGTIREGFSEESTMPVQGSPQEAGGQVLLPECAEGLCQQYIESKNILSQIAPDLNMVAIPVASGRVYQRKRN